MNDKPHSREYKQIRIVTLVSVLLTVAALSAGLLVAYWSFTGTDVLKFNKEPIPVHPKFVKSEGKITLDVDFCKLNGASGRVTQRLVSDKTEIFAPTVTDFQPKGCYHYPLVIPIPPQTPAGEYHVNYRVIYKTNPLHTVIEDINSEVFEVTVDNQSSIMLIMKGNTQYA